MMQKIHCAKKGEEQDGRG